MSKHLSREMDRLERGILTLGTMVEEAINKATIAIVNRRPQLATEVIEGDELIDQREVELEEDCLKVLALHQPVAVDLRYIIATIKVNSSLERMGDLAQNLAQCALDLSHMEPLDAPIDMQSMIELVLSMVKRSLNSLVEIDAELARGVLRSDDEVDNARDEIDKVLSEMMQAEPHTVARAMLTSSAVKNLERIADQATNIAEDIVFMVEGDIIRHGRFKTEGQSPK